MKFMQKIKNLSSPSECLPIVQPRKTYSSFEENLNEAGIKQKATRSQKLVYPGIFFIDNQ